MKSIDFSNFIIRCRRTLSLILLIYFALSLPASAGSSFYGEIRGIDAVNCRISVYWADKNAEKSIEYNQKTKFFRKNRPRQNNFESVIGQFKKGDIILVVCDDADSASPTASQIWDRRAVFYKNGFISTEISVAGEISLVKPDRKRFILKTFDGKERTLLLTPSSKIFIKNLSAPPSQLTAGSRVIAFCRWKGFEEDMPDILEVYEIMDNRTYITRKYSEKFGSLLASGRITGVDMNSRLIKFENGEEAAYGKITRWIPATPKIRKPSDFTGQEALAFGVSGGSNPGTARMILNTLGINSIFEAAVRQGDIPGSLTVIAYGNVVSITGSAITVNHKGGRIACKITKETVFTKRGKKIKPAAISTGEKVLVKGIFERNPIAVTITVFGGK